MTLIATPAGPAYPVEIDATRILVADGVTDDSANVTKIRNMVKAAIRSNPYSALTNAFGRSGIVVKLPPRPIMLKSPGWVIPEDASTQFQGMAVVGAGAGGTQVCFQPTAPGQFLWTNADKVGVVRHRGIEFICDPVNSPGGFLSQNAVNVANDQYFEDCTWNGTWAKAISLHDSANLNGVWKFYSCRILGTYDAWLESDASNTDQALHYTYDGSRISLQSGDFHRMYTGGDIVMRGGTVLIQNGTGTLFNLLGTNHIADCDRFNLLAQRIEAHTSLSQILYCSWNAGIVMLQGVTQNQSLAIQPTDVLVHFDSTAGHSGPQVTVETCRFRGKHQYSYRQGSYQYQRQIVYRNTEFVTVDEAKDAFVFDNADGLAEAGSIPVIRLENCRGGNNPTNNNGIVFDTDLNWQVSRHPRVRKRIVRISGKNGAIPVQTTNPSGTITLPFGSLITKVIMYLPAGATTSTTANWRYRVWTSDHSVTLIDSGAIVGGVGGIANPSLGFRFIADESAVGMPYECSSDARRNMTVDVTNVDATPTGGYILVEYI